jgi:hypothetical protein
MIRIKRTAERTVAEGDRAAEMQKMLNQYISGLWGTRLKAMRAYSKYLRTRRAKKRAFTKLARKFTFWNEVEDMREVRLGISSTHSQLQNDFSYFQAKFKNVSTPPECEECAPGRFLSAPASLNRIVIAFICTFIPHHIVTISSISFVSDFHDLASTLSNSYSDTPNIFYRYSKKLFATRSAPSARPTASSTHSASSFAGGRRLNASPSLFMTKRPLLKCWRRTN